MNSNLFLLFFIAAGSFFLPDACAQPLSKKQGFTRQDSLRGSIGPERAWWDVLRYEVAVTPDFDTKSIKGKTTIEYKVLPDQRTDYMQIDLQQPLELDSLFYDDKLYISYPARPHYREGNVWHIPLPKAQTGSVHSITMVYHGEPVAARRPPWDGGWIWQKDEKGRPWMSVACQGLGASSWFPCKDHQSDEPDNGASLSVTVPDPMVAVGNGQLRGKTSVNGTSTYTWEVQNPINSYNIIPYIGYYVNFTEGFEGEKGRLNCSYWVLDYNLEKARSQFKQATMTLKAMEHWFGPFPWYEDDFKLVEAPHLGMEHQSAVAYGNRYLNGYLGADLSGTGVGKKWDFIIVHEVGHEWFGNNITTKDIADMWIHEGFTSYSETLFTEYHFGKADAEKYVQGIRKNISNDIPVIGPYGVNQEGSGDMYYKGANLLHTIRQIIGDDEKFRQILRGLNKDFYHQTVSSKQVEAYISRQSGIDLSKVFDQYLRTSEIPVLELQAGGAYRWTNCVEGFNMPVRTVDGKWLKPTTEFRKLPDGLMGKDIEPDPNFYIEVRKGSKTVLKS
ncbi:MAG TPA: M1 family metallopeptidase [Flavisolibacter sp.]|nr:M1 family metallopeptidase [Flavisolibacter sp.]